MDILTDREKYIAHYISVSIIGAIDKQPRGTIRTIIDALQNARVRNLSGEERDKIIDELDQEFLMSKIYLDDRRKAKLEAKGYGWGDLK